MRRTSFVLAVLARTQADIAPQVQAQKSSVPQPQSQPQKGAHCWRTYWVRPPACDLLRRPDHQQSDRAVCRWISGWNHRQGNRSHGLRFRIRPTNKYRSAASYSHRSSRSCMEFGTWLGAGGRLAFVVNEPTWGFTPLVNKSWPIKHNNGFFKAYFVETDLPVRFSRPVGAPANNAVTFAMHFGVSF
ncbi:MAG: hypothetical protein JWQ49_4376 [Edaphobacter sp.]|nr:hypothetical protein [Edaphobacter sp.]